MQLIKLNPWQVFRRSLAMVLEAAPSELRTLTLLTFISGAGPAIVLLLSKIIIDEAARLLKKAAILNPIDLIQQDPLLFYSVGGLILFNLLSNSLNTVTTLVFASLRDRVQGYVEGKVIDKVANFTDIALFETPKLLNIIQLTEKGIDRLEELAFILITTLNGFFIFLPAVLLSGSIAWWIPLILFTSASPSVYVELKYRKRSWRVEETQVGITRNMELYKTVLMSDLYAKELRLFGLQNLLINRWHSLFKSMFFSMQRVRHQGALLILFWSILSSLGIALPYLYVVLGTLQSRYTLGDLALYAGLILQVRQSLFLLINSGSDLYDVILGTTPIFQVLDLQPRLRSLSLSANDALEQEEKLGIQIKNLSFSYPGGQQKILDQINLTIHPQEIIALVGENGAGKTTLTKLLCRLYDPDAGQILWQGKDLREIDWHELHSRITVVMQDYAQFPTTVRENIGFGSLPLLENDQTINQVLQQVGMQETIDQLPKRLETPLGRELEGGIELSEGQWQRIAIARALMRLPQAELLIFDEPTAALDAKTEYEIYQIFRTLAKDKMAVVISHRLALCKLSDRIIVLEDGKIIEMGSHEELMAKAGRYHLMFTRQASSYR